MKVSQAIFATVFVATGIGALLFFMYSQNWSITQMLATIGIGAALVAGAFWLYRTPVEEENEKGFDQSLKEFNEDIEKDEEK